MINDTLNATNNISQYICSFFILVSALLDCLGVVYIRLFCTMIISVIFPNSWRFIVIISDKPFKIEARNSNIIVANKICFIHRVGNRYDPLIVTVCVLLNWIVVIIHDSWDYPLLVRPMHCWDDYCSGPFLSFSSISLLLLFSFRLFFLCKESALELDIMDEALISILALRGGTRRMIETRVNFMVNRRYWKIHPALSIENQPNVMQHIKGITTMCLEGAEMEYSWLHDGKKWKFNADFRRRET